MRTRWTALALAVLAAGIYAHAAGNRFALDDEFIVVQNQRAHQIDSIPALVRNPYWPDSPARLGLYRPLTVATYALEWDLWDGNPLPFHLTNIALHALVTVLTFLLLVPLVGRPGAAAGAAVFAVHPVHVEAVANVVGRAELLATAFVLAAALLYQHLRADRTEPPGRRHRLWGGAVAVAVLYFLGLASKEIAVTLPGLLVVLEAGRGRPVEGSSWRAVVGRLWGRWPVFLSLAGALAVYLWVRSGVLGTPVGNDAAGFLQPLTGGERLLSAVAVWPEYLRLMLFPAHLAADYSPGVLMPVTGFGLRAALGLLVGGLAVGVGVAVWRRERAIALGVAWFAVAVFPVSNLVIPIGVLLAERTLYLPSVGLALAVGGGWHWLAAARPSWRRATVGGLGALLLLGGARTWARTPTWRDTSTVMATLARDHPESFRVRWLQADRLRQAGRTDQALAEYRRALDLVPLHYQLRFQYGVALMGAGRLEEAIHEFRSARDAVPELPDAHVLLMVALLRAHRPQDAITAGREALRWIPDNRGIQHQMAIALTRTGDYAAALDARTTSIRASGERAEWRQFLHRAELLVRLQRPEVARADLEQAAQRAPEGTAVPDLATLERAVETADTAVLPYR